MRDSLDDARNKISWARRLQAAGATSTRVSVDMDALERLLDIADVAAGLVVECYWGGCGECPVCRFNAALEHLYDQGPLPDGGDNR